MVGKQPVDKMAWRKICLENKTIYLNVYFILQPFIIFPKYIVACTIKNFKTVIVAVLYSTRVLATANNFHPSLIFVGKAGAYQCRVSYGISLEW
jgi:hypothetical protein